MRIHDPHQAALEVASTALHWVAHVWYSISPEVSAHVRRIADTLHAQAKHLKECGEPPTRPNTLMYGHSISEDDDTLDP